MAFVPTAGVVKVDMTFLLAGQQVHNTFMCSRAAPWTAAERTALADAVAAWWNTTAKVSFSSQMALTQVTVTNQDAANAEQYVKIVSPAVAGGAGAASVPNNAACCVTLRTALRGRNYRGRMYFAGIPTTSVTDSVTFLLAFISGVLTALSSLKTTIEGLGAVWVVVSKYFNKTPRAQGLVTPITAVAADTFIDSQRRRLSGRGV